MAEVSPILKVEEGSNLTVLLMLMSSIMENIHCKFKMFHFQLKHVQHSSHTSLDRGAWGV